MPFYSKDGFSCSCNKNECDECMAKYIMKTNADRIRSMTDEELTNWITYLHCPHYEDDNYACDDCEACWHEWLKQECE